VDLDTGGRRPDVVNALRTAAREAGTPHHVGIVESSDAYYADAWLREQASPRAERMRRAGILAIEMEASALFVVGRLHGIRTGCVLTLREEMLAGGGRKQGGPEFERGLDRSIAAAIQAVRLLARGPHLPEARPTERSRAADRAARNGAPRVPEGRCPITESRPRNAEGVLRRRFSGGADRGDLGDARRSS
jgi:purine-nucleoside phosphorylase